MSKAWIIITGIVIIVFIGLFAFSGDNTTATDVASFSQIEVSGEALNSFETDVQQSTVAPIATGENENGKTVQIGGSSDKKQLILFLAHWCPHCNNELPEIVDFQENGALDEYKTTAVLTASSNTRPNFPPVEWVREGGYSGEILLDDEVSSAASSFGLTSLPYVVVLDTDGKVVDQASGEGAIQAIIQ